MTGRLEQRSWDGDNGEKRYKIEVIADDISPSLRWATAKLTKTQSQNGNGGGRAQQSQAPAPAADDYSEPF